MPRLLEHLRAGFQILGFGKPLSRTPLSNAKQAPLVSQPANPATFGGLSEGYLQQIIDRVSEEGFHVESLNLFRYGNLKPAESIKAIEQWANRSGLKVSFNSDNDICFFEKR